MTVKSERITILGTPDFKSFLSSEAKREGVSVSELVRLRCKRESLDQDEQVLQELIKQALSTTAKARKSLDKGMKDARSVIKELRRK